MAYSPRNANGQATMANSEPVVLASDQSSIPVTVSGVSTAANQATVIGHLDGVEGLLTTIDADTSNLSTKIDTLAGAVAGTEMQVDVLTMPTVTVTATNLDVQSGGADLATSTQAGAIQTAVELIDNAIGVEDAAETVGGGLMMAGSVRRDTAASSAGTTGDNATLNTDSLGRLWISGAAVEDVAETAGGILLMAGSVRRDTAASSAGTTGDNATINTDSAGKLWVTGTVLEDVAHSAGEQLNPTGVRRIDTPATSAGTSGDWATMDASAEGALWTTNTPTTTGGCSVANFNTGDTFTALTNTAQVIKASAGNFYGYYIYNPNATATYVMLYNVAAASVTVGTTTPAMVFCIPATSGANLSLAFPITFSNAGWSIAAATTGGGNSAPATALEAMIFYK